MKQFVLLLVGILCVRSAGAQEPVGLLAGENSREIVLIEPRTGVPLSLAVPDERITIYRGAEEKIAETIAADAVIETHVKDCERAQIRRERIGPTTPQFVSPYDVVLFNFSNKAQVERAANWKGDLLGLPEGMPFREFLQRSPIAAFVMTQPFRCLPTRARIVNLSDGQYREFREGDSAWSE